MFSNLPEPPLILEAREELEEAERRFDVARLDYPYSPIDLDDARENYQEAIYKLEALSWG